jgi:hypothetical protein
LVATTLITYPIGTALSFAPLGQGLKFTRVVYGTTKKFLEVFRLATLRDLPDIERIEEEGLLHRRQVERNLDETLGMITDDALEFEDREEDDLTDAR